MSFAYPTKPFYPTKLLTLKQLNLRYLLHTGQNKNKKKGFIYYLQVFLFRIKPHLLPTHLVHKAILVSKLGEGGVGMGHVYTSAFRFNVALILVYKRIDR